eukprot:1533443-Amphidinium_carterae.1
MLAMTFFSIDTNRFTGALPDGGMRAVIALTYFSINANSFTGALPDGGMRAMRALERLLTFQNRLAGMLPEGIFIKAMSRLYIWDNFFAGTVAESLPRSYTSASLGEIARFPGLYPPNSLDFPFRPPGHCQQRSVA